MVLGRFVWGGCIMVNMGFAKPADFRCCGDIRWKKKSVVDVVRF